MDGVNQWKDAIRAMLAWQSPTEQQAGIFFFLFAKPLQAPWGVSCLLTVLDSNKKLVQ